MSATSLLVERAPELASLVTAAQRARSGSGRFVMVEGAAGIGKSSLLAEAARLAVEAGGRVLLARGTDLDRQFSFGLVRQLYEPVLARTDAAQRQALLSGAAGAAAAVFGPVEDRELVGDFAVLHGLYWLTANLCRDQLLALVVDDLHWADLASLRFLAHLQPRLEGLHVVVVAATRPHEPDAEQHLLDMLTSDQVCTLLRPAPLSPGGSAAVIGEELSAGERRPAARPSPADPDFLAACHAATGGNPLLLRALARVLLIDGIAPKAANADRVPALGPRALADRIEVRLARLPAECAELARAVAVLGDNAPLLHAAALAGLGNQPAVTAVNRLQQLQILQPRPAGTSYLFEQPLRFTHPLVHSAIYDTIEPADKMAAHAAAAQRLATTGADPEHIAVHLLRVPPAGDVKVAHLLRRAAKDALSHGAPDAAVAFLERCLQEPPPEADRVDILEDAGTVTGLVDEAAAAKYLTQALSLTEDVVRRARVTDQLAKTLLQLLRTDDIVALCTRAAHALPADAADLRRRMEANILHICLLQPDRPDVLARLSSLRSLPASDSIGGRELDCEIALIEALAGDPSAVPRARRALGDDVLIGHSPGEPPVVAGWIALLAGDADQVMDSLDSVIARGHRHGSARALAPAYAFRGWGWLWRGQLAEAEADVRKSAALVEMANIEAGRAFVASFLADILIERGRPMDARAILEGIGYPDPAPPVGAVFFFQEIWARLLRSEESHERALSTATACGRRFAAHGGHNPAVVAWRSEAALSLHAMGQVGEARAMATEELELARRWGAPRALGRALRVSGLVHGRADRIAFLHEAVSVLEGSPAQLEHAKALVALGTELHRDGDSSDAKVHLSNGLDLAHRCGATLLVDRAGSELRAAGARPRRLRQTGPDALTPSESRVASLAAEGQSNRDIAEQLFVTVKTVEVHLSNTYRKLGITRRVQLRSHISGNVHA